MAGRRTGKGRRKVGRKKRRMCAAFAIASNDFVSIHSRRRLTVLVFVGILLVPAVFLWRYAERRGLGPRDRRRRPGRRRRVRWQGEPAFVLTDAAGCFRLPMPHREAHVVTASAPGYRIAAAVSATAPLELRLDPLPADDNEDYRWLGPHPDIGAPGNCGNCHDAIHREWNASALHRARHAIPGCSSSSPTRTANRRPAGTCRANIRWASASAPPATRPPSMATTTCGMRPAWRPTASTATTATRSPTRRPTSSAPASAGTDWPCCGRATATCCPMARLPTRCERASRSPRCRSIARAACARRAMRACCSASTSTAPIPNG